MKKITHFFVCTARAPHFPKPLAERASWGVGRARLCSLFCGRMELQETAPVRSFASLTSAEAAERLKCDVQAGLSSSEAEQRLTLHGPNCARRTAPRR